jgi:hypothetical protein
LKTFSKKNISNSKKRLDYVLNEKKILDSKECVHNFIIYSFGRFQTVSEMVLVMEFVPCGDLWSLMHQIDEVGIDVDSSTKSPIFPTKFLSFNSKTRSVVTPVRDDGVPRSVRMKSPGGLGQGINIKTL